MVSSFIWNCNTLVVDRLEILERKLLFGLLDVNNVGIDLVRRGHQPLNNVTWRPDWCGHPRMPWTLPHQSHIDRLLFSINILLCTFRFHFLWQIVFTHGALFGVRSQIIFFLKCKTYWNLTQSPLLWIFKCVSGEVWICIVGLGLKWKHLITFSLPQYFYKGQLLSVLWTCLWSIFVAQCNMVGEQSE